MRNPSIAVTSLCAIAVFIITAIAAPVSAELVGHWALDEPNGTTGAGSIADATGNFDLTPNGATGLFIFTAPEPIRYTFVTVLCTDTSGNSSALSRGYELQAREPTPMPTATEDPNVGPTLRDVFIPLIFKSHESGR